MSPRPIADMHHGFEAHPGSRGQRPKGQANILWQILGYIGRRGAGYLANPERARSCGDFQFRRVIVPGPFHVDLRFPECSANRKQAQPEHLARRHDRCVLTGVGGTAAIGHGARKDLLRCESCVEACKPLIKHPLTVTVFTCSGGEARAARAVVHNEVMPERESTVLARRNGRGREYDAATARR